MSFKRKLKLKEVHKRCLLESVINYSIIKISIMSLKVYQKKRIRL